MRIDVLFRTLALGVSLLSLVGCGEDDGGVPAPVFPPGSGQLPNGAVAYPAGPYGVGVGSIIENYQFVGFANAMADTSAMQLIQLADFYNPTGEEVFPEGSPYGAGEPKPKALLIDVSSVWCPPCNEEAKDVLPSLYEKYQPQGGEFLLQLADGPTRNVPAEPKHLYNWTLKYKVDYPAAIDPSYKLSSLFEADAFPANMIIKTKDMTIVEVISGSPTPGTAAGNIFWKIFEKVLSGEL
jgi:hypothetical protein